MCNFVHVTLLYLLFFFTEFPPKILLDRISLVIFIYETATGIEAASFYKRNQILIKLSFIKDIAKKPARLPKINLIKIRAY